MMILSGKHARSLFLLVHYGDISIEFHQCLKYMDRGKEKARLVCDDLKVHVTSFVITSKDRINVMVLLY